MKKLITLITVSLLVFSCERNKDTLGPNLSDIYGDFQFFEEFDANRSNVDFSIGESVLFTAAMRSKSVGKSTL